MNAGDDTGRDEGGQAWPFLIGGSRDQASRIVVIPGFLDNPEGLAALSAATTGIQPSANTTVLRQLQGATSGPVSVIYRSSLPRASDYGLGGDGILTDNLGHPIRLCEGLVLRLTETDVLALGITRADLDGGHARVTEAYRAFWSYADVFARRQSAPIAVGGSGSRRGPTIELRTLDPAPKAPIPEPRGRRKLGEASKGAIIGGIFAVVAAVAGAVVSGFYLLASTHDSASAGSGTSTATSGPAGISTSPSPTHTPSTFPGEGTPGLITLSSGGVDAVAFSVDGNTLAAGNADGIVRVWNAKTWRSDGTMTDASSKGVTPLAFNNANNLLAAGDANGHVYLYGDNGTHPLFLTDRAGQALRSVAFTADDVAVVGGDSGGHVYVWQLRSGKATEYLVDSHSQGIGSVSFNSRTKTIAAADGNGLVYLWWYKLSGLLHGPVGSRPLSVAYSPDGSHLAVASSSGNVYVWPVKS